MVFDEGDTVLTFIPPYEDRQYKKFIEYRLRDLSGTYFYDFGNFSSSIKSNEKLKTIRMVLTEKANKIFFNGYY